MSDHPQGRPAHALIIIGVVVVMMLVAVPGSSASRHSQGIDEVRAQVEALYHDAERITERVNELEDQMALVERRVRKLTADIDDQEKRLEELRSEIGRFIAADYRSGGADVTVRLLVADDPDEFLMQMSAAKALVDTQADLVRQLRVEEKRLAEQYNAREAELSSYRKAKEKAEARKEIVQRKAAEAKAMLDRLTAEERRRMEEAEERERVEGRSSRGGERPPSEPEPPPSDGSRGATALAFAIEQLGDPYEFGAAGPDRWDCSGLTMMAWRQAGVSLPHSARQQYLIAPKVDRSDLRAGDIVLFYDDLSHNGLYVGDGMIIHAPRPGKQVEYIPMEYMPYYGAVRPG